MPGTAGEWSPAIMLPPPIPLVFMAAIPTEAPQHNHDTDEYDQQQKHRTGQCASMGTHDSAQLMTRGNQHNQNYQRPPQESRATAQPAPPSETDEKQEGNHWTGTA